MLVCAKLEMDPSARTCMPADAPSSKSATLGSSGPHGCPSRVAPQHLEIEKSTSGGVCKAEE